MIRLGVICPSEIAFRRFMPALNKCTNVQFVGIGVYTKDERFGTNIDDERFIKAHNIELEKAKAFIDEYGGVVFDGYNEVVSSDKVDAVYIPLPPALHFKWAKKALENGKHVLIEKPSTITSGESNELIQLAKEKGLAIHENYMFTFHNQLEAIDKIISSGEIGKPRLYRINFGFPMRAENDFRYNKDLGGGALIDAGGYTIKYATRILGDSARIVYAKMNYLEGFEVDMYGSAAMINDQGQVVQLAFGMDNNYKCELEVWGSKGCLNTGRVLTAPDGYVPQVTIRRGNVDEIRNLPSDDAFMKSINHFLDCISDYSVRCENYQIILKQAKLVDQFREMSE